MIDLSKNAHDCLIDGWKIAWMIPSLAKTTLLVSDAWRALCMQPTGRGLYFVDLFRDWYILCKQGQGEVTSVT